MSLRIVYMGTPEFAVAPLKAILEAGYEVAAVVTMPDKPAGRGMNLQQSPVKQFALEKGLPVLQPEKLKDEAFIAELKRFKADIQVVVAFRMLPEVVWNMPPKGTFNLHASLLPQYRGAAPINWAIINGEKRTGVTTFFLEHQIDTGNIIYQKKTTILPKDNIETVYDKLMILGSDLVLKTLKAVESGNCPSVPQHFSGELKPAPKIFKETCRIDWNRRASDIHNLIRGLSPYPAAWCMMNDGKKDYYVKIFCTAKQSGPVPKIMQASGGCSKIEKQKLKVACLDNYLQILDLQVEGKKRMAAADFLRGLQHPEQLKFF
jgi:methionyl-tRNA formyltransferase